MRRLSLVTLVAVLAGVAIPVAHAQDAAPPQEVSGAIDRLALDRPGDPASDASIVIGGTRVVIPSAAAVRLPAVTMSVSELFEQAPPACRKRGESGLAAADACRKDPQTVDAAQGFSVASGDVTQTSSAVSSAAAEPEAPAAQAAPANEIGAPVAKATVSATRREEDGALVAVAITITKNVEQLWGGVTFVNEDEGYVRLNGPLRTDEGGTVLRINDPLKQMGDQRGLACGTEGNCSPDARFRLDTANLSVRFDRGNPVCIGGDAQGCPGSNRSLPPDDTATRMPVRVGDNLKAEGAYEVASGVRFFSAQAVVVQTTLPGDR